MINFQKLLSLPKEEEEDFTFNEIEEGIYFRGHNLWLLVISMGIACIGLNINSPAAVIGAMLISPLMGPIVGAAFGFSIGNRHLIKLGIINWALMIVVALCSSTLYFFITPFHSETAQLESFKTATVFDCFLAILGGFAWFLGIVRKEAIKVIAGVAVSTACIPPLCTAGFGIANGNWEYFWGGFYFYLINCFFIGVGTWILSIVLGYQKYYLQKNKIKNHKISLFISLISVLILIPSIWLTKKKWDKEKLKERSENYIKTIKENHPELAIINHEIFEEKGGRFLKITLLNDSLAISKERLEEHNSLVKDIHLIWQYSPKQQKTESPQMKDMQTQISELKQEIERIKTKNNNN
ncbi:MAG: hypothetical protein K0R36_3162 [Chryseobacterium sp.]|jgi:uncharacterized hydrophobic protein (TIGR00271 family)|uniref:DUF389 domain-containing protein n=1 Tax=Chryseobacterium sp. TaxID=1871047 RepID=UPI002604260D|nr:DUF389 domain-containing protein [Chryseobacterium sp.]MDF2551653.1 hypothetical protein [Chryseobacterium sp.]MDF2933831.1 hypothetical protein [Chryseobacterium sp.]